MKLVRGWRRGFRTGAPWLGAAFLTLTLGTPARAAEHVWLEIEEPPAQERGTVFPVSAPIGLVEVRGWAGTGRRGHHDVVIVLDRSLSVWGSSGADVDGDGAVGVDRRPSSRSEFWTTRSTDAGDTILQAELLAARRLIERLDPETTRMSLVSFASQAKVRAPLGSTRTELLAALDSIPESPDPDGTYLSGALKRSVAVLAEAESRAGEPERHRSIILLSDGLPNLPGPPETAAAFALQRARDAGAARIRIYAFALGPTAVAGRDIFEALASASRGELVLVDQPAQIVDFVPHISLTELDRIEVENLSTSDVARAVRVFPDGSFDAYAPLRPGRNLLRVTAIAETGERTAVDREIFFTKTPAENATEQEKLTEMLKKLRLRTLETELAERARHQIRTRRVKSVDVRTEVP